MQSFANFMSGTMIFHLALKQLIGVYEVFLMKWDKKFPPGTRAAVQPVSLHQISVEIKSKYKPNFVI
jgi:hypothetical protein